MPCGGANLLILLLVLIYLAIIVMEIPAMLIKGWHRELLVFTVLFLGGVYLSLAQLYDWPLYNPLESLIAAADRLYTWP